ncbi:MAG TPA: hypothetical protein VF934_13140 [Burkholderiales bacterium]
MMTGIPQDAGFYLLKKLSNIIFTAKDARDAKEKQERGRDTVVNSSATVHGHVSAGFTPTDRQSMNRADTIIFSVSAFPLRPLRPLR